MTISEKIQEIIALQFGFEFTDIAPETTFDDLEADSLGSLETVIAIEKEFNIQLPDNEIKEISTVGDMVNFVESKVKDANAKPALRRTVHFTLSLQHFGDRGHRIADQFKSCADCGLGCRLDEPCKKSDEFKQELQARYPSHIVGVESNNYGEVRGMLRLPDGNSLPDMLSAIFRKGNGK